MVSGRAQPIVVEGDTANLSAFAALDELAARARFAFLVEMDHFIAEKYEFRLLCLRYLASRGWTVFGEELAAERGRRADDYLRDGDESRLDPPDEEPWFTRGPLANARQPGAALDAAQRQQMIRVRRLVPDARWFGFDADRGDADYLALANAAERIDDLGPAMARREEIMWSHVEEAAARHPGEKIALMAGSLHLMKDDAGVEAPGVGAGPGGGRGPSLGHRVVHELADGPVLAIWLLHGRGRTANPWLPPPGELRPARGTVDAALARRYGHPMFLATAGDRGRRRVTHMHNLVLECELAAQADAVVFVPRVHPIGAAPPAAASGRPRRARRGPLRSLFARLDDTPGPEAPPGEVPGPEVPGPPRPHGDGR